MSENASLAHAKRAKNDEFYTQYNVIEAEMNAYVEYNPDVFRGKTIFYLAMIRNGATLPNISLLTFPDSV